MAWIIAKYEICNTYEILQQRYDEHAEDIKILGIAYLAYHKDYLVICFTPAILR